MHACVYLSALSQGPAGVVSGGNRSVLRLRKPHEPFLEGDASGGTAKVDETRSLDGYDADRAYHSQKGRASRIYLSELSGIGGVNFVDRKGSGGLLDSVAGGPPA